MLKEQQNRENYYFQNADKTNEEKILETLTIIMERLDDIEEKINNFYYFYDNFKDQNIKWDKLPSTMPEGYTLVNLSASETDCKILTINENGEPI